MQSRTQQTAFKKRLHGTHSLLFFIRAFSFLSLSLFILIAGLLEKPFVEKLRGRLLDFSTTVIIETSKPVQSISLVLHNWNSYLQLHKKLEVLQNKFETQQHWEQISRQLNTENNRLRELLNMVPQPNIEFITARAYEAPSSSLKRSLLINAGTNDGIKKNQVVISQRQILGRIIEVGDNSSRVLLLTDGNSRIPVHSEISKLSGILTGNHSPLLELIFPHGDGDPQIGEILFTSGHGGVFPSGYKVGVIQNIINNKIKIRPEVDLKNIDFVQVLTTPMSDLTEENFYSGEVSQ